MVLFKSSPEAWKRVAGSESFKEAEHNYIKETHYKPVVDEINKKYPNLNLNDRSQALRDVIWSMSVQHSKKGNMIILDNAFLDQNISKLTDKQIINLFYDNRMIYMKKNSISQDIIDSRTIKERIDALEALLDNNKGIK